MRKHFIFAVGILMLVLIGVVFAEGFDIAVLLPGTVEFFSVERRGMDKAAEEFGLNLIYADAEWDAGKQLAQVENFIARNVDLILLCAADNLALRTAVTRCNEAGIPIIAFTNTIGTDPYGRYPGIVSYVGRSDLEAGIVLGKIAESIFEDESETVDIVLIEGNPGTAPQRMREEGFMQVADKHPNWNIVDKRPIDGWTKEGALAFMEAFLQSGRHADLVACQWWSGAIAAAMALKEKGIDDVYVIGLEFAKEIIPYIESGEVYATTYFSVVEEGYKAVETAYKYLSGEEVPEYVLIEQTIVTKDNLKNFEPEM
ncbi:MAG: sugar ABC transporter substrate-binding protein [Thermotogae bacterium]|nr:sugar ABC transporter substrate-binding protein [Thermotogota bacterium]